MTAADHIFRDNLGMILKEPGKTITEQLGKMAPKYKLNVYLVL